MVSLRRRPIVRLARDECQALAALFIDSKETRRTLESGSFQVPQQRMDSRGCWSHSAPDLVADPHDRVDQPRKRFDMTMWSRLVQGSPPMVTDHRSSRTGEPFRDIPMSMTPRSGGAIFGQFQARGPDVSRSVRRRSIRAWR